MDDEILIQTIREEAAADNAGRVVPGIRVDYMVGKHGPFTLRVPKTEFDPMTLRQKLVEFKNKILALKGGY